MNKLFYGDNLDILRRYIKDESVDLIYLDPPFNSNATYNVLFSQQNGTQSSAQIQAFEDTWRWDENAVRAYELTVEQGGKVADALRAFRLLLGDSNMMAYLAMMAPRLVELHRVLKKTGSLYLHCDPTASHYLKVLLDMVFGVENLRNEIVWQRTSSHNDSKKWGAVHDIVFYYAKTRNFIWNPVFLDYDENYLNKFYVHEDEKGRYRRDHIIRTASLGKRPNLTYEYKGYTPEWGWRTVKTKLESLDKDNRLEWSSTGRPYLKRYLHEQRGTPIKSVITDIPPISSQSAEKLGYPTQKPEKLLERIIEASSNEGDVVLDPFCGCGTAVAAAQKLNRQWIGIDVTHLAIGLIKRRMADQFGDVLDYEVIGEPTTIEGAKELADMDKFQFEWWALGLVGARPADPRKGADRGIDGRLYFHDDDTRKTKQVILSVKGGATGVSHIRDLVGVLDREKAQIGVLISLREPTQPMRAEAASAGFYDSPWGKHARVQILTIEELLGGKGIDMPPMRQVNQTFKRAPRHKGDEGRQMGLLEE